MTHYTNLGRVIDFYSFPNYDFRATIRSQNGNHSYTSQVTEDVEFCACIGFRVHKHCNHMDLLITTIQNYGDYIPMNNKLIKTSIKGLNDIMGGLPIGLPIGFYGEPRSGKSTIAIWALLDVMNTTDKNGLILDAEKGLAIHVLPDLIKRFNNTNKSNIGFVHKKIDYRLWLQKPMSIIPYITVDDSNISEDNNIVIIDISNIKEMLMMVGKPHKVQLDGPKPKLTGEYYDLFPNDWDTPLAQILDNPNSEDEYCGFILDSLTCLTKEFGVANQAFPARDTAQSIILNQITQIINVLEDMTGIIVLHASKPPQDSTAPVIPVGGKAIGHGLKYSAKFSIKQKENLNTSIIIEPYRLPTKLGNLTGSTIVISDKGVF